MRRLLFLVLLACLLPIRAGADGFHGAMNAEQLSHKWNQNKYAAFVKGGTDAGLGTNVQNLLNHMKFLNRVNVRPSEFPNFKDKDIPGVKSQAMAILKEMGDAAVPTVVNNQIQTLNKVSNQKLMGMKPNKDYVFNLKLLLEDIGRDAVLELRGAISRSEGSTRAELQRILDRILRKEKSLGRDLELKGDDVLSEEIQKALRQGIRRLLLDQGSNGSWSHHPGYTALGLLTLLKGGMDPAREECRAAATFLSTSEPGSTYDVALKAMALSEFDRKKYRPDIQECARWLEVKQLSNGMWGYGRVVAIGSGRSRYKVRSQLPQDGDNSNTQFALLGLMAARSAGIKIDRSILERTRLHFNDSQAKDG